MSDQEYVYFEGFPAPEAVPLEKLLQFQASGQPWDGSVTDPAKRPLPTGFKSVGSGLEITVGGVSAPITDDEAKQLRDFLNALFPVEEAAYDAP